MIEERGRVVGLESGAVWVQTQPQGTCSGCAARSGCGQGLMDGLGLSGRRGLTRAVTDLHLQVGDSVVIGISESALLRSTLLVYLLPLLLLLVGALLAQAMGLGEPFVILGGLAGFACAWLWVRRQGRRLAASADMQPVVLRALLGQSSCVKFGLEEGRP